jgi:CO/xanthine dehydrogenase Mo-binding subunit
MGLGEYQMEAQAVDKRGLHLAPSLLEYQLPTSLETPEITVSIIESLDPEGPYGAKEAGEGPENPIVPAIANAVSQATGVGFDSIPVGPDRLFRALHARPNERDRPIPLPRYDFPPPERAGPAERGSRP